MATIMNTPKEMGGGWTNWIYWISVRSE